MEERGQHRGPGAEVLSAREEPWAEAWRTTAAGGGRSPEETSPPVEACGGRGRHSKQPGN